ncbi:MULTISPECIES: AraC family transcriptional regulator [Thiorhodovibrio]|uniref:AraC family transcriptional regulator n=1 Tax=Thiorhodovibrio TaxID=61593 RepID=UPI001911D6E8|nr:MULTISPECIES: AraC family transcriptional regulator [Thiorhodovibrio]WPL12653.1 HTH-type transcriptional regulator GadX [Thiorhodovibrio litoralis]
MSARLAIVRAAHLRDYLVVMRRIGMPVGRELARSRLPPQIEEAPDLYVSVPVAIEWIAQCGRDLEPMELGFLGARQASRASIKPAHLTEMLAAQTGYRRLEAFIRIACREDNGLRVSLRQEGDQTRVICDMVHLARHPFICFAEWLNLQGVMSIMSDLAGPNWCPRELTFVSRYAPPELAREAFPNTRMLVGQACPSILIDSAHLARVCGGTATQSDTESDIGSDTVSDARPVSFGQAKGSNDQVEAWDFLNLLRMILQPYLNGGHPDLSLVAEIVGMSPRTLQRRLQQSGSCYSQVLQEARFDLARGLLGDPGAKIIDVAMTAGYDSQQHFTRAFRRFTGLTPTGYRRACQSGRRHDEQVDRSEEPSRLQD